MLGAVVARECRKAGVDGRVCEQSKRDLGDESQNPQAIFREHLHSRSTDQGFAARLGRVLVTHAAVSGASAPIAPAQGPVSLNLNKHGAACRCLLRLRENHGEPGMSDAAFIARFLPHYPVWSEQPGVTDLFTMLELAKALQLADRTEMFRGYDHVLQAHRAGHGILVYTEFVPEQSESPLVAQRYVLLMTEADEETFALWCPYASGQSEVLPRAARRWWDHWAAIGVVLERIEPTR